MASREITYTAVLANPQVSERLGGETFGARVSQVKYLSSGVEVSPGAGLILIEWSYDGVQWNPFTGSEYHPDLGYKAPTANGRVRYIRASGSSVGVDTLEISLVLSNTGIPALPEAMIENDNLRVVTSSHFDAASEYGRAFAASQEITIQANSEYSVEISRNALPSAYTLGTWEANGGAVKIRSGSSVQIYDIVFNFDRTHKAR